MRGRELHKKERKHLKTPVGNDILSTERPRELQAIYYDCITWAVLEEWQKLKFENLSLNNKSIHAHC